MHIIGIDEAGRGPLAGPVAVGAVFFPEGFDWSLIDGVRDSKLLTPLAREAWYERLLMLEREAGVRFAVSFSSPAVIDARGMTRAVAGSIARSLSRLDLAPEECKVLLDGLLHAPALFTHQQTIIRGDVTEPAISLASIAAKVRRDRLMRRLAKQYPEYGFDIHKGYGTRMHRSAIQTFGLSDVHRRSFCKKVISVA